MLGALPGEGDRQVGKGDINIKGKKANQVREGKQSQQESKINDNRYKKCEEERNHKTLKRKRASQEETGKVCQSHTADL